MSFWHASELIEIKHVDLRSMRSLSVGTASTNFCGNAAKMDFQPAGVSRLPLQSTNIIYK